MGQKQKLLCLVWGILSLTHGLAVAQESSDETASIASEAIRELSVEKQELLEHLQELDGERNRVKARLEKLSELIRLQKELESIARQIDLKSGKADQLEQLEQAYARLELQVDMLHESRRLEDLKSHIAEIREFAQEVAPRELRGITPILEDATVVIHRLEEAFAATVNSERPTAALRREMEKAERLNSDLDDVADFVELVDEYLWTIEDEEFDAREELREEVLEYIERSKASEPRNETPQRSMSDRAPELLPVNVNPETLIRFRETDFQREIVPLLETYCMDCHSSSTSYGELNLEEMISQKPLVINRAKWINVIEQAKNRVMPTEDGQQPTESERQKIVLGLHNQIHNFDYSQIRNPGYETTRRLTHQEYDNTISDLFGVRVSIAGRFPKELSGSSGFDNSGNTLFLQPLLLERYATAADEVVDTLLPPDVITDEQKKATAMIFFRRPSNVESESEVARVVLRRFASRAYRRPLTGEEEQELAKLYSEFKREKFGHRNAIREIVRQTLISPKFLLKFEALRKESSDYRIDDWELASRLSYFLWASMPDTELFRVASTGTLSQPDVLKGQVNRMLQDERAKSLGEIFAAQWLGSQHVGTRVRLDPIDNPWCTDSLMSAMRQETALFFHALVTENTQIKRLVDADFTFLNSELAAHYRIGGVSGTQMQRVKLQGNLRGGVLGQGSVLAVTSFPYRTSPVVRGKWILETLLGTPPPPPPPNVSELAEDIAENRRLSIREKLARHRQSPSCNACHSEMDPLGLSLEKYDWFGRYRERYERGRIDDSGSLPGGVAFKGLPGLKQVISDQRAKDLIRQVTSKMLSYALGRQLEFYDETTVQQILAEIDKTGNRFQPLIHQIVQSYPFQYKQVQSTVDNNFHGVAR